MNRRTDPRPSSLIREQLKDLAVAKKDWSSTDFASEITRLSLERDEQALNEELRAAEMAESEDDAVVLLDGGPVEGTAIQAGFLSTIMTELQHLVYAVAQVRIGRPTDRAAVPSRVVAEHRLLVSTTFASSFGLKLRFSRTDQLKVLPSDDADEVLADVAGMLAEEEQPDSVASLTRYGRVRRHYELLLEGLAKHNGNLAIRTRKHPFAARMSAGQARDRQQWLELLGESQQEMEVEGILAGGNTESSRFELLVEDERYKGHASSRAVDQMKSITFGAAVAAKLIVITRYHEDDAAQKEEYVLDSVSAVLP